MGLHITALPEPSSPAMDVQLIIGNDHVQYVKQIPIDFVPGTNKTVTVTLVKTTGTGYLIMLPNGDRVDISKSWVEARSEKITGSMDIPGAGITGTGEMPVL